jgi:excisionase family DNA binding protein
MYGSTGMADAMEDLLRNIVRTEVEAIVGRPPRKAWTVREVAASLGVSESTVHGWIKSGRLRAFRSGNVIRIPDGAVDELVAS